MRYFDRTVIREEGLLTDRHIAASTMVLQKQFPHVQGLQSTLQSEFEPIVMRSNEEGRLFNTFVR